MDMKKRIAIQYYVYLYLLHPSSLKSPQSLLPSHLTFLSIQILFLHLNCDCVHSANRSIMISCVYMDWAYTLHLSCMALIIVRVIVVRSL